MDKYRSPPPPGNEKGTENLGKTRQRSASLAPQSTRTGLGTYARVDPAPGGRLEFSHLGNLAAVCSALWGSKGGGRKREKEGLFMGRKSGG